VNARMTVAELKEKIRKEKKMGGDVRIVLSLDQSGRQPADEGASLGALNIRHGTMLYAQIPKTASVVSEVGGKKIIDGKIVSKTYADRAQTEGFRPGLMALRSMKMHWTLSDFSALDAQYTYTMKGKQPANCRGVSLYASACDMFQRYAKSMAFSPRVAHLYGRRLADKKIQIEVFYEPPQNVDETGCAVIASKDPHAKAVDKLALWLGLERVGFAFCHPQRDADEVGYRFSAYELLEAAEQNLSANGGDPLCEDPFAIVVVTGNKDGTSEFDAFEINKLSLKMVDEGVLLEDEDEPGLMKVHDTFTVVVEARATKKVSTYRCIKAIPILQHDEKTSVCPLGCTFPTTNRPSTPSIRAALRAHFVSTKTEPHLKRVADFQVLLALFAVMGEDSVRDLCGSIRDRTIPIKEGYKLILDSLMHG